MDNPVLAPPRAVDAGGPLGGGCRHPRRACGTLWTAHEELKASSLILTEVRTDDGLVGWGEAKAQVGGMAQNQALTCMINEEFAPLLKGEDPRDITRLWETLYSGTRGHYALREGSGGAGKHRGGMGLAYEIELLRGEARASFVMDHGRFGPQGAVQLQQAVARLGRGLVIPGGRGAVEEGLLIEHRRSHLLPASQTLASNTLEGRHWSW